MLHTILHFLAALASFGAIPGLEHAQTAIAPLLLAGGMAGASLVGGLIGNRRSKEEKAAQANLNDFANYNAGQARLYGSYAGTDRASYLDSINSFDPASYLKGETSAVSADIQDALNQGQGQRNRSNAARGFYGGALGTGNLNRQIASYTGREAARLSTTAGTMQMQKMGMYGNLYGMDSANASGAQNTALDLYAGNRDYEAQRRAANNATWQNALGMGGSMYGMAKGYGG